MKNSLSIEAVMLEVVGVGWLFVVVVVSISWGVELVLM